ncbi:hypothetical protein GpartN1_g877.t1 [Galdieria partita]|uniref:DUF2834 domain-containing protein n=1 Tax=Galdieria partita TaxID=83374 RepID=A0A9C7UN47_9RHOD|nr:hypothetical protein GpartN1_g877.t1 [Galdieria partita]
MIGEQIAFHSTCCLSRLYRYRKSCTNLTTIKTFYNKLFKPSKVCLRNISLTTLQSQVESNSKLVVSFRRLSIFSVWVSFLVYAFSFAPGSFDMEWLRRLISNPFDSQVNSIFVFIFNGLGVLPALYSSLLLPREKEDSLKAWPFLVVSFFLGFFALGPYLVLRKPRYSCLNKEEYRPTLTENSWFRYSLLIFVIVLYLFSFKIFPLHSTRADHLPWDISLVAEWDKYLQLFHTDRLVHVSSIDFVILCLFLVEPLFEDMKLRGFFRNSVLLDRWLWIVSWIVPLIGPSIYLCTRPQWNNK